MTNLIIQKKYKIKEHKYYFFYKKKKKIKKVKRFYRKFKSPYRIFKEKIKNKKRASKNNKFKLGVLRILTKKRNIFCTLSDRKGNIRATVSSGLLKVKGRKRQALHIVKKTGQKIIDLIFKHNIRNLLLIHKGNAYKKKKKTLLRKFSSVKKLKFLKVNRPAPRSHNGCRPSKMRRK